MNEIEQLHEQSGLSWEQLAELFEVSVNVIELWRRGGMRTLAQSDEITWALAAVESIDAPTPAKKARKILTRSGPTLFADTLRNRLEACWLDAHEKQWAKRPAPAQEDILSV